MNDQQRIGVVIKKARTKKGMSQGKLAQLLNVQNPVIYKYEKGIIKTIPFEKRANIASVLNIPIEDLFYTEEIIKSVKNYLDEVCPDWENRNFIPLDGEDDEMTLLLEKLANEIKNIPLIDAIKNILHFLTDNKITDIKYREEIFNLLLYDRGLSENDRVSLASYCANIDNIKQQC